VKGLRQKALKAAFGSRDRVGAGDADDVEAAGLCGRLERAPERRVLT